MLRVAAAAALLTGVVLVLAYLHDLDKGPWTSPPARHQRAMKDRVARPAGYETMTFADMADLPRGAAIADYARIEGRAVSVEGYVQRMFRARDGDYHLDFAPTPGERAAAQRYYCAAEITPQWHLGAERWRFERLAAAFRPLWGAGSWDRPPVRTRLSGWLMYEHEHAVPAAGATYPALLSQWEIHPVTRIEVWDDARAAFVELER